MPAKKLILAVDDDASICEFYLQGLKLIGYDAACVGSTKKAREYLKGTRPDLILMDIMMPEEDGISLTRKLRNDTRYADIPIVVVSGLADAGTLNDALLFGAVDYMVKPIDLDALKAKLERTFSALERRKKPA